MNALDFRCFEDLVQKPPIKFRKLEFFKLNFDLFSKRYSSKSSPTPQKYLVF